MLEIIILLVNFYCIYARRASPQEVIQILDYHNGARRNVSPSASNMLAMKDSTEMTTLAEAWAKKCKFAHPSSSDSSYRNTGQNIAITFGHPNVDFRYIMGNWHKEKNDYNYARHSCTPGKKCGHYTQMVWSTSSSVGCAVEQCNQHFRGFPSPVYLYVCQYKPPGNYLGRRPYNPGQSCSECPRGTRCRHKLCY